MTSLSTKNQPIPLQLSVFAPPAIAAPKPKPKTTVEAEPQPITPKSEKTKPKPKPKPKPEPEPEPEPKLKLKPQSAVHNPQPQMAALGIESAQQRYENALSQALKKNQSYPRRAKRRHKEGRVKVSFTIHQSGAVSDVHILNGSGSFILDKAAVKAVKKINGLMPFPKELKKSALSEVISFNYTLN